MRDDTYTTSNGRRTLGPQGIALFRSLEERFVRWAGECDAVEKHYPVLMPVSDLARFDYFRNFPHIAVCGCSLHESRHDHYAKAQDRPAEIPPADLAAADHVLAPAACYNIYLDYENAELDRDLKVTTVAQCHRNETHYRGLARLRGFTMREIVCIGTADGVKRHLAEHKQKVTSFLGALGLPFEIETASDPFFDKESERAVTARLFPTKEEVTYTDAGGAEVAIASFNFHRNFFGERCGIRIGGETAYSGCVAFGIERWIHALLDRFGSAEAARDALSATLAEAA